MSMTSAPEPEPTPIASEFLTYGGEVIRIVEAQHKISTDRLVNGPAAQDVLEKLVEEAKPTMPLAARGLHHLLATPFRYGFAKETRFRRAHERPGIFYASEEQATAIAETAFWRMRFFAASPGAKLPKTTVEYWAFSVPIRVIRGFDLTKRPLNRGHALWTLATDYGPCQRFAAAARSIGAQLIRYKSVRDPNANANIALFDPSAFQKPVPKDVQTWHFRFHGENLIAFAALPATERFDFDFRQFGLDPP